jgi:hypothetical protein
MIMTAKQHAEINHPASEDCISIRSEHLSGWEYHGPDLTLCMHKHCNIGALMRAPKDCIQPMEDHPAANLVPKAQVVKGYNFVKSKKKRRVEQRSGPQASATDDRPAQANIQCNLRLVSTEAPSRRCC